MTASKKSITSFQRKALIAAIVLTVAALILLPIPRRLALLMFAMIGLYMLSTRIEFVKPEKILAATVAALLTSYLLLPGIASHLWHKLAAHRFDGTVRYLASQQKEGERFYVWSATRTQNCDTSLRHDFSMSETLRYYGADKVTFVPGPQYSRQQCVDAALTFRSWQTKFFPESLRAYEEGSDADKYFVLVPESDLKIVQEILVESGKTYETVYAAPAGRMWDFFYDVLLRISKFTGDSPGYLVLQVR